MRIAADGSIYIVGRFTGTVDFDPSSGTQNKSTSSTDFDAFILKLNASGQFVYVKTFGGGSNDGVTGLAIDSNGNVYVSGSFTASFTLDSNTITSNGGTDVFLLKLDSSGTLKWIKSFGSSANDTGGRLDFSHTNELNMVYYYGGQLDVDPSSTTDLRTLSGNTNSSFYLNTDVLLAQFTTTGTLIWAKSIKSSASNSFNADKGAFDIADMTTDSLGFIYLSGKISGAVDVNTGDNQDIRYSTPNTYSDVFITRYSNSGAHQYTKLFGGSQEDEMTAIFVDSSRSVFGTGMFSSPSVDFNPGSAENNESRVGSWDSFVVRYSQSSESIPLTIVRSPHVSVDGRAKIWMRGGKRPYTYAVSPETVAKVEGDRIVGVSQGNFSITVTDASGASVAAHGTVGESTTHTKSLEFNEFKSSADFQMVSFPFHHFGQGRTFLQNLFQEKLGAMSNQTYMLYL